MTENLPTESNEEPVIYSSIPRIVGGYIGGMMGWLIGPWVTFYGVMIILSSPGGNEVGSYIAMAILAGIAAMYAQYGAILGGAMGAAIGAGLGTRSGVKMGGVMVGATFALLCGGGSWQIGLLIGKQSESVVFIGYVAGAFGAGVGGAIGGWIGGRG